jgi:hypothetical protein
MCTEKLIIDTKNVKVFIYSDRVPSSRVCAGISGGWMKMVAGVRR